MILKIDNYKFYEYDPNIPDQLIVTCEFAIGKFECKVEGYTNVTDIEEEYPYCNKKYICHYVRDMRRYKTTCYDTYPGYEEEEIKKSIRSVMESCYNKNKKGRKIKFE